MKRAFELAVTNRLLSAQEAEAWGIVNRVVPDADLLAEAEKLATELASGATGAFGGANGSSTAAGRKRLKPRWKMKTQSIAARSKTDDGKEGIAAFLEKRAPRFNGQ